MALVGFAIFVGAIPVKPAFLEFVLWVIIGASLLLVPFVFFKQDITRTWGIVLTGLYLAYMAVVL